MAFNRKIRIVVDSLNQSKRLRLKSQRKANNLMRRTSKIWRKASNPTRTSNSQRKASILTRTSNSLRKASYPTRTSKS